MIATCSCSTIDTLPGCSCAIHLWYVLPPPAWQPASERQRGGGRITSLLTSCDMHPGPTFYSCLSLIVYEVSAL
eukprot:4529350-Amphidinium_carterae.1